MITPDELDRATAARKVELTRANARPVRCALASCRALVPLGEGFRIFVDGHPRGFACRRTAAVIRAAQRGVITPAELDRAIAARCPAGSGLHRPRHGRRAHRAARQPRGESR